MRSQMDGVPHARHHSTHARMTPYEGKNTRSPSGTMRATFTMTFPSSVLYASVSRNLYELFSRFPLGPTGTTAPNTRSFATTCGFSSRTGNGSLSSCAKLPIGLSVPEVRTTLRTPSLFSADITTPGAKHQKLSVGPAE